MSHYCEKETVVQLPLDASQAADGVCLKKRGSSCASDNFPFLSSSADCLEATESKSEVERLSPWACATPPSVSPRMRRPSVESLPSAASSPSASGRPLLKSEAADSHFVSTDATLSSASAVATSAESRTAHTDFCVPSTSFGCETVFADSSSFAMIATENKKPRPSLRLSTTELEGVTPDVFACDDSDDDDDCKCQSSASDSELSISIAACALHLPEHLRRSARIVDVSLFDYDDEDLIGDGKSASVFRATFNGEDFALKRISRYELNSRMWFLNECSLISFEHRGIARVLYMAADIDYYYLVLELGSTDLFRRILSMRGIKEARAKVLAKGLLEVVHFLHSAKSLVHMDLKPENIVFVRSEPWQPKVIDFSEHLAVTDDCDYATECGTWVYTSPERWGASCKGWELKASDVWSVGVIMYESLTAARCFAGTSKTTISANVKQGMWRFPEKIRGRVLSEESRDFVASLLTLDAKKRPTAKEALEHPWLS